MKKALERQFDIWREETPDSPEVTAALKNALDVLENLSKEADARLSKYILGLEQQAFAAGFRIAMQLAAECFGKDDEK